MPEEAGEQEVGPGRLAGGRKRPCTGAGAGHRAPRKLLLSLLLGVCPLRLLSRRPGEPRAQGGVHGAKNHQASAQAGGRF